jgi:hypothetical protein
VGRPAGPGPGRGGSLGGAGGGELLWPLGPSGFTAGTRGGGFDRSARPAGGRAIAGGGAAADPLRLDPAVKLARWADVCVWGGVIGALDPSAIASGSKQAARGRGEGAWREGGGSSAKWWESPGGNHHEANCHRRSIEDGGPPTTSSMGCCMASMTCERGVIQGIATAPTSRIGASSQFSGLQCLQAWHGDRAELIP